jgi:predicted nuclease of predicted toxin-antitoxin system
MPPAVRFHLDENVDPAVAAGLRHRGVDVTTAADAGLRGASDMAHLSFAERESRVLVTHDHGFLQLHRKGARHAGIVYCHQQRRSVGSIIRSLELIWLLVEPERMQNGVEFI